MTALKVLGWVIVVGVTVALYAVRIDAVLARVPELDQLRTSWMFYAVAMLVFVAGVALVLIGDSRGKKQRSRATSTRQSNERGKYSRGREKEKGRACGPSHKLHTGAG